jgi:hypothetical protein
MIGELIMVGFISTCSKAAMIVFELIVLT